MSLDLEGGIRNALERGASVEEAIKSFVSAGYSEQEVRAAASLVSPTLLPMTESPNEIVSKPEKKKKKQKGNLSTPNTLSATDLVIKKEKNKSSIIIVFLVFLLLVLLASFAASLIYKEQLIELIRNLLGK